MKKLCILFLALSLLLGLAACGSTAPDNPNCGLYEGKYGEMSGFQIGIHDMYEKGFNVELGGGGKGTIVVDGTQAGLKWTLNGSALHIEGTGVAGRDLVLDGTVADGVMVLKDVLGSGVDIYLECAELLKTDAAEPAAEPAPEAQPTEEPAPEAQPTEEPAPEAQPTEEPAPEVTEAPAPADTASDWSWWEGKWYGWGCYYTAGGQYASLEDNAWDVFAKIVVDGDQGTLYLWDINDLDETELEAQVSFGPGSTAAGRMTCESALFADALYGQNAWSCDPADYPEGKLEHTFLLTFYYRDAENSNNFVEVCYILRPWGMLWDDVLAADTSEMLYDDMMPFHYEDWYLPQLEGDSPDSNGGTAGVPGELVGSWEHSSGYTYVFAADGTGSYGRGDSKMEFTYTVEGDQLSILYTGNTAPFVTTWRIEGTTLIILDSFNSEVRYEKK